MTPIDALLIGLGVGVLCGAVLGWVACLAKRASDPVNADAERDLP
jgi:hypothetical protein